MHKFSFKTFQELTTERLVLRQLKATDVDAIYSLQSNSEINRLITREIPKNIEEARAFILVCHQEYSKQNRIFWVIELQETKQVIGTIAFHNISLNDRYAEIGYELHPKFHKNGFMNEATNAALDFGIHTAKFYIIEAFTHQNNTASIALLQKHHFVFQSDRRDEHIENNRIFRLEID